MCIRDSVMGMDAAAFYGGKKQGRVAFLTYSCLYLLAAPFSALQVPPRQCYQGTAVNVFGEPAESHVRLEPDDDVINGGLSLIHIWCNGKSSRILEKWGELPGCR